MYKLIFFKSKALARDQKKLIKNKKEMGSLQEALGKLAVNPFACNLDIKKLKFPAEATFRLRVGNFRILFDVDTKNHIILIYRMKPRKEGYG